MAVKPKVGRSVAKVKSVEKYSPSWLVSHVSESPGIQLQLIDRIRNGVKKEDWKLLIKNLGATEKEFENILPSSISSMQKKKVYGRETSIRIYEISRLFGLGFDVFESQENFKSWLFTPSKAFGNKIPFELLDSSFGFELVENEIYRIQYNVYS